MNAPDTSTVLSPSSARSESAANVPAGAGERLATVASNACVVDEPLPSVAVTVTVVVPPASGVTVTTEFATATVATVSSDEAAVKVRASLSGSVNAPDTSTVPAPSSARSESAGNVPAAWGGRLATVTVNVCVVDEPPPPVPVTVTVVVPCNTGVTVTTEPATATVATVASDEAAVKVRFVGSVNALETSTDWAPFSTCRNSGDRDSPGAGAGGATVTSKVSVTSAPSSSTPVTVIVAVPGKMAVTSA